MHERWLRVATCYVLCTCLKKSVCRYVEDVHEAAKIIVIAAAIEESSGSLIVGKDARMQSA